MRKYILAIVLSSGFIRQLYVENINIQMLMTIYLSEFYLL